MLEEDPHATKIVSLVAGTMWMAVDKPVGNGVI
jgi:hypothetical protein